MITEGGEEDWAGGGGGLGRHGAGVGAQPVTAVTVPVRLEGDFIVFRGDGGERGDIDLLGFLLRFQFVSRAPRAPRAAGEKFCRAGVHSDLTASLGQQLQGRLLVFTLGLKLGNIEKY